MGQRIEPERQPRENVADRGNQREPVSGESRRDQEPVEPGHGPKHREIIGRERFDAGPAPGDRPRGERA